MSIVYRSMLTDGSVEDEIVSGVQVQNMTDEAALVGKQLTNFSLVFSGTVAEANANIHIQSYVPEFVPDKDHDGLRLIVHSAEVLDA